MSTSKFQPGGTAILSRNLLSHKAQTQRQQDPTGLGRWSSTLYQGQQHKKLQVIQLYRPCKPNPHSHNGVFQQHSRFLLSKQITTCPRAQLLLDIQHFILQCQQNNEQIILMGDFNDNINQPPISTLFSSLGMHNVLASLFPSTYSQSPQTYIRGSSTIDGIFATQGVVAEKGGYLEMSRFDTDHRPIWIDISIQSIFGTTSSPQIPLQCRRLKNDDPRTVKRFNTGYQNLLTHHNLHHDLNTLTASITGKLNPTQQSEYERIDTLRVKCILKAERKCRRLKTGNVEYSPTLQLQRDLFQFWKLILKRRQGQKIDSKYLTRWERKLHLKHTFNTPIATIKNHIQSAKTHYQSLKKLHSSLRDEWIEQLAAAKAAAGNKNSVNILSQLRKREQIRRAHRQIR